MNEKRAQELLKHITSDKDKGLHMMETLSLREGIYVISHILQACIKKAEESNRISDLYFFQEVQEAYRPFILDKIKNADQLWMVYCDYTGYPYENDKKLFVLFDYKNHDMIKKQLNDAGFQVSFVSVNKNKFKNEISHMYRNGYDSIYFIDGRCTPFLVSREELFQYDEFFSPNYITNPGLQISMISYFQELRKPAKRDLRTEMLKRREDRVIQNILNAEFMIPCEKTEDEENIEITHPFIDLSEQIKSENGEKVIAIPAFTDGFELQKCYQGHYETMLYKFDELLKLTEELEASGFIINCLGISYYMPLDLLRKLNK